jgi:hypothetical protein
VRVRIFTTQEELPFAGHPTLGTASVLKLHAPETVWDTVTLALNVGPVPVRFSGDGLFGEMTQRDPEFGAELDPGSGAADRAWQDDLDPGLPPQVVSTGTAFAIVALRSRGGAGGLKVNQREATVAARARRAVVLCAGADGEAKPRSRRGGRGCSSTAARIRRRDRRLDAPSATWYSAAQCAGRADSSAPGRGDGPSERSVSFCEIQDSYQWADRQGDGCARCGQHRSCSKRDGFSCRDAHAFNRHSSLQVTALC